MSKLKLFFFFLVLLAAAAVIIYEKQLKPTVNEIHPDIEAYDYYKIMWFGPKTTEIKASDLKHKMDYSPDSIYIIDLRSQTMYDSQHIKNSLSMPFDEFLRISPADFKKIDKILVFISQKGKLAELSCKLLSNKNIKSARFLKGGIDNWEYKRIKRSKDKEHIIK